MPGILAVAEETDRLERRKAIAMVSEQQRIILHEAAKACGLDGHISEHTGTVAERAMLIFGGNRKQPRKNSYLYLDSVDACFYIQQNMACCVFSARWFAASKDLNNLAKAGMHIKRMLTEIQSRIDSEEANQGRAASSLNPAGAAAAEVRPEGLNSRAPGRNGGQARYIDESIYMTHRSSGVSPGCFPRGGGEAISRRDCNDTH